MQYFLQGKGGELIVPRGQFFFSLLLFFQIAEVELIEYCIVQYSYVLFISLIQYNNLPAALQAKLIYTILYGNPDPRKNSNSNSRTQPNPFSKPGSGFVVSRCLAL